MVISYVWLAVVFILFSCHHDVDNNNSDNNNSIGDKSNINKVDMQKNDIGNLSVNEESENEDNVKVVSKSDIRFLIQNIQLEQKAKLIKPDSKITTLKNKYHFVLVGDTDYGILKEPDLWFYDKYDRKIDPNLHHDYLDEKEEFYYATSNHAYWHCFPKENIQITLTEYSLSDDEPKEYRRNYRNQAKLSLLI